MISHEMNWIQYNKLNHILKQMVYHVYVQYRNRHVRAAHHNELQINLKLWGQNWMHKTTESTNQPDLL